MSSGVLQCTADVTVAPDGAPICHGTWELVPVPVPFDPSQLDPATVGQAFGAGFVIVASLWCVGRGIKAVLSILE